MAAYIEIRCDRCGRAARMPARPNGFAALASQIRAEGWRQTAFGNDYCRECVMKRVLEIAKESNITGATNDGKA